MRRLLVVTVLVLGLTAGCSDESDPSAADGTTSTAAPSSEDDRSPDELAADQAAAEEIVLTLDDFDPGWEASPAEEDRIEQHEMEAAVSDCLEVGRDVLYPDNPSADSPDFAFPDDEGVTATVSYAASVEAAEQGMERINDEDLPACFAQTISDVIEAAIRNSEGPPPDDMEIGEPTFNPISFASLGDDTVAYRATISFSTSGMNVSYYLDVVLVRVGRVEVERDLCIDLVAVPNARSRGASRDHDRPCPGERLADSRSGGARPLGSPVVRSRRPRGGPRCGGHRYPAARRLRHRGGVTMDPGAADVADGRPTEPPMAQSGAPGPPRGAAICKAAGPDRTAHGGGRRHERRRAG